MDGISTGNELELVLQLFANILVRANSPSVAVQEAKGPRGRKNFLCQEAENIFTLFYCITPNKSDWLKKSHCFTALHQKNLIG